MDNKFNEVRRLVEEDDELKTSDRYTKVRAKNHLFEWSGQQLDILLRRVAGAKKVLTNLLSKKADLVDGKVPKSQLPSDIGVDAVLFSPQTLTPQQQEQARKNIGGDNSYISFINGQTPIQGIRYVDVKDYPNLSGNYTGVFYDEDQQEIYCLCAGNSTTGGVVKISKNKVVARLNMDASSNGCERPIVKIGEYLYVIQLGWSYAGMISKLNANDLSIVLQVKDSDKIGYYTPKGGLFFIGEELYLWGG